MNRTSPTLPGQPRACRWLRALVATTLVALFAVLAVPAPSGAAEAESGEALAAIKASGKLRIGVKKDVLLWGYQDPRSGELAGMEVDLARALGKRLGVAVELVGLRSVERIDAVQSGRVDVLIATLSDSPERRVQLKMIMPHYYSSGVNLLARKSEHFRDWSELKNRKICARRGSYYNRPITVKYGADIVAFHSLDWALQAVRDGRCSALVYDDTAIVALLLRPEWAQSFEMPMPTIFNLPWAVAIAQKNAGSTLEHAISDTIVGWHRDGYLIGVEKSWHIPATDFLRDIHAAWSKRSPGGNWHCGNGITATTPPECL